MAEVVLDIGGFRYPISCREGEQDHFRSVGAVVDQKVTQARGALGGISETRQLLFAALLLADALKEAESRIPAPSDAPDIDPAALEGLAERLELLASQLENRAGTP